MVTAPRAARVDPGSGAWTSPAPTAGSPPPRAAVGCAGTAGGAAARLEPVEDGQTVGGAGGRPRCDLIGCAHAAQAQPALPIELADGDAGRGNVGR